MAKSSTTFGKDKQPSNRRGRSKKNLILESIKERALLGLSESATNEDAEKAVFGFMADAAFNPTEDTSAISNTCMNQLMKKGWPDVKPVYADVEFDLDENASPHEKANQILKAVSQAKISPDVANVLITSIASMLKIEELTSIKERLEQIEKLMGVDNG